MMLLVDDVMCDEVKKMSMRYLRLHNSLLKKKVENKNLKCPKEYEKLFEYIKKM